jgi:hypothetical protein
MSEGAGITLRPEVQAFAEIMEERLQANEHKGGWENCEPRYLRKRVDEEFWELLEALERDGDVAGEAADVGERLAKELSEIGKPEGESHE